MRQILIISGTFVLVAAGVWCLPQTQPAEFQFLNRAAVLDRPLRPLPDRIAKTHGVVVDRALLIRDPVVLDDVDFDSDPATARGGKWRFGAVFARALNRARAVEHLPPASAEEVQSAVEAFNSYLTRPDGNAGTAVDSLFIVAMRRFEGIWSGSGRPYILDKAPLRLLAIVNRIDLAHANRQVCKEPGHEMQGAEIRFVYQGIIVPTGSQDYLRMIVEFVMPCLSPRKLQDFGAEWQALADGPPPNQGRGYFVALEHLLDTWTAQSPAVRIRVTGQSTQPTWVAREYPFSATGPLPSPLEQELNVAFVTCEVPGSELGRFGRTQSDAIIDSHYETPPGLQTRQTAIQPSDLAILTLLGDNRIPSDTLDKVRHSLSVNTCRGCHSRETATNGLQIGKRMPHVASDLSAFLTGDKGCGRSSDTSQLTFCRVNESALLVKTDGCAQVTAQPQSYNDLLRRHEYLDQLLHPSHKPGSDEWQSDLAPYAALQVH